MQVWVPKPIKKLLEEIDLDELVHELREEIRSSSGAEEAKSHETP